MDRAEKLKALSALPGVPEEIYDELLIELSQQVEDLIKNISNALDTNDFNNIRELAHFVKGSAGNLRVQTVFEITKQIQQIAETTKQKNEIQMLINKLKKTLADLLS